VALQVNRKHTRVHRLNIFSLSVVTENEILLSLQAAYIRPVKLCVLRARSVQVFCGPIAIIVNYR